MSKKPTVSGDHTAFRKMEKRLEEVGGSLQDLVTMTVFILDVRHGLKFGGGGGGGDSKRVFLRGLPRRRPDHRSGIRAPG